MTDSEVKIINHSLTRLLAMREHSQHELISKLTKKGLCERTVRQQLSLFVEQNIQSDWRYVESYIRAKSAKGQGKLRIRQALQQHDIADSLIQSGFEQSETDFAQSAMAVYQKKYGDSPITDFNEKQKRMRFLQYRGFSSEEIHKVIKEYG